MNSLGNPADETFRQEVRVFLRDHLPADLAVRNRRGFHASKADMQEWLRICATRGWSVPNWPKEQGGPGWSITQQQIFEEEYLKAGAPLFPWAGPRLVGPVIYTYGNAEQKARHLPPIIAGDIFWGQGFSEPGAGSDLAALRTRADLRGDHYIVNGHKTWMTIGHYAEWLFVLVRTDPVSRGNKGISFLLVEVDTPGVTVRPIITIDEGHSLNEVFFDEVRVPAENLVGEAGKGWEYARFLLANERYFAAEVPYLKTALARLKQLALSRYRGGRPLLEAPWFGDRMAELEIDMLALEFTVHRLIDGDKVGPAEAAMLKVRGTELQQAIGALQMDALGDDAIVFFGDGEVQAAPPIAASRDCAGVAVDFLYRRAVTIYSGSNEIQRNLIARQLLPSSR